MKFALHIFLVIVACIPFVLHAYYLTQNYPSDNVLMDVSLIDCFLLLVSLGLPVLLLPRLGVNWRKPPEEY